MMEASAQLLLENSVPKSTSKQPVSSQSGGDSQTRFSDYLNQSQAPAKKKQPNSENGNSAVSNSKRTDSKVRTERPERQQSRSSDEVEPNSTPETKTDKTAQKPKVSQEQSAEPVENNIDEPEVKPQQLKIAAQLLTQEKLIPEHLVAKTGAEADIQQPDADIGSSVQKDLRHLITRILADQRGNSNPSTPEEKLPLEISNDETETPESLIKSPVAKLVESLLKNDSSEKLQGKQVGEVLQEKVVANRIQPHSQINAEKNTPVDDLPITDIEADNLLRQSNQPVAALLAKLLSPGADRPVLENKKHGQAQVLENLSALVSKPANLAENDLDNLMQLLEQEGFDMEQLIQNESLLNKIMERLDLDKNKNDILFQTRMVGEKSQNLSDFVSQLSQKMSPELVDKAPLLSPLNAAGKPASVLPQSQFVLATPVNQPGWSAEFNKRIHFMIKSDIQQAELRLDPPELGRIHVKINLNQEQANVTFTAANNSVRDAIEQTLPRLRELLGESGLQLGQTDVGSQFQQQKEQRAHEDSQLSPPVYAGMEEEDLSNPVESESHSYSVDGVIDYFA